MRDPNVPSLTNRATWTLEGFLEVLREFKDDAAKALGRLLDALEGRSPATRRIEQAKVGIPRCHRCRMLLTPPIVVERVGRLDFCLICAPPPFVHELDSDAPRPLGAAR